MALQSYFSCHITLPVSDWLLMSCAAAETPNRFATAKLVIFSGSRKSPPANSLNCPFRCALDAENTALLSDAECRCNYVIGSDISCYQCLENLWVASQHQFSTKKPFRRRAENTRREVKRNRFQAQNQHCKYSVFSGISEIISDGGGISAMRRRVRRLSP